jgi:hypothetical protein
MDNKRFDERIDYISNCILIYNDEEFTGLLNNISTTGALIEMNGPFPHGIKCEDACTLKVLLLSPVKYSCKIVHLEADHVGLQFLGQIAVGD